MKASDLINRRISRKEEIRNYTSIPLLGIEEVYGINISDGDLICVAGEPKAKNSGPHTGNCVVNFAVRTGTLKCQPERKLQSK